MNNNYIIAIKSILRFEGGYGNDPDDGGGETYKGISRVNWPRWAGWKIIDAAKGQPGWENRLDSNAELSELVLQFYKVNFWDKVGGDNVKAQSVVGLFFDAAVNEGISAAIKREETIMQLPITGRLTSELIDRLNSLI